MDIFGAKGSNAIGFVAALAFAIGLFLLWRILQSKETTSQNDQAQQEKFDEGNPYEDIEPLPYTDLSTIEPIKIRPFKPRYFLTMALENCPLSEFLAFDKTYLERMKIRQDVMDQHTIQVYDCDPKCEPAVMEMYEWIFGTYLPKRLPGIFKIVPRDRVPIDAKVDGTGDCLFNGLTGEHVPLKATSAMQALYTMGKNVDDDILILLPSSNAEDGSPIYHLEAFVCCFPSGFSLPEKFRQPLATIHTPVPGYKAKLEKSMDRFFAKLEVGRAVRRANWAITTNTKLFTQAGNHLYSNGHTKESGTSEDEKTLDIHSADIDEAIARQKNNVKIENCRLRTERQTLHRLPQTEALVFAFKTYQYRLDEVKAEGNGLVLAEAIDGLRLGNTPEMEYYKRGVVWGDVVKEYLRS